MSPQEQAEALELLRECARILARAILGNSPDVPYLRHQLTEAWRNTL